ncbi:MAG: heparan N-sulfatase, partial [Verrucomicrobiota bacterium]|nr:heparan N-sulfatase [Verrucomicrobiota bacterium]
SSTFEVMRKLRDAGQLAPEQRALFAAPRAPEELYDLEADPHELRNLAAEAGHRDTMEKLRSELEAFQRDTQDRAPGQRRPDGFDRETGEKRR